MSVKRGWLPREGLTADIILRIFQKTALNLGLTLPLLLLSFYTQRGRQATIGHETALKRLQIFVYLGAIRWINNFFSAGALNNWQSSRNEWSKEIVIITGGSDGIGKNIALLLQERGAKVVILDVLPLTFEAPPNISFFECDITSPEAVSSCASTIRSAIGNPTILVNNAGIAQGSTILNTTDDSISKIFEVNTISHFRLVREFLPAMVAANHGSVVTIASMAASISTPQIVPYCCTKASALAFHEGLSAELKTRYNAPKVRTIAVCPGWTHTRMTEGVVNASKFLLPWQFPETVAEKVVDKLTSGTSGVVYAPEMAEYIAMIRAMPMWWQIFIRNGAGKTLTRLGRSGS